MTAPSSGAPGVRRFVLALLCLAGIQFTAPWPGPQAVLNTFLVLGLGPGFASPLAGMAWAAAAGWVLEGSLRLYPHLGGTAFGNMLACLLAFSLLLRWPPHTLKPFWGRQAVLVVVHTLLVQGAISFAAGAHAWGYGWLWSLLLIPAWATLALRLHPPLHRK
jgi:hypothetical protein